MNQSSLHSGAAFTIGTSNASVRTDAKISFVDFIASYITVCVGIYV